MGEEGGTGLLVLQRNPLVFFRSDFDDRGVR